MRALVVLLVLIGALPMISACSTTFQAGTLNASGRFDSYSPVTAADEKVTAPFDKSRYENMAVVLPITNNKDINNFFLTSIKNSNRFKSVLDKSDLERLAIKDKVTDVNDVTDILSLHKLSLAIGPFLVVKPYVEWKGGYNYMASIDAIDPATGDVVFHAQKSATNWAGLDKTLFYPLFNALIDWTDGKAPPPAPPPPPPLSHQVPD